MKIKKLIILKKNNVTIQPEENNVKIDDIKVEHEESTNQFIKKSTQLVSIESENGAQVLSKYSKKELDSIEKI